MSNLGMATSASAHTAPQQTAQADSETQTSALAWNQDLREEGRVDGSACATVPITMQKSAWCAFTTVDVLMEWRMMDFGVERIATLEHHWVQSSAQETVNSSMSLDSSALLAGINAQMDKNTQVCQHAWDHAQQEQLYAVPKVLALFASTTRRKHVKNIWRISLYTP